MCPPAATCYEVEFLRLAHLNSSTDQLCLYFTRRCFGLIILMKTNNNITSEFSPASLIPCVVGALALHSEARKRAASGRQAWAVQCLSWSSLGDVIVSLRRPS